MKIKKSDLTTVIQWIDVQLSKDDKFPFDQDTSSKASKKHLKALKAWRKCSRNIKEVREWCDEWLDKEYASKLTTSLDNTKAHKADHTLKLTLEAHHLLISLADKEDLSPSQLIVAHFSSHND
ncbi:hypothetical protein [Neptunomonas japonica]|uniref:Uncharacterized protein n=1 Tax=Neptunomonas japonica JAMM 1380 TaxID=1441457 RepID=A0A7R6PUU7_9GAMM|nr:hypothetical protein [Neptunomonas japonica]BBB29938.1 hypothetical protein NEJAP_1988 [Neptunomonas japonica JAMM 1380]